MLVKTLFYLVFLGAVTNNPFCISSAHAEKSDVAASSLRLDVIIVDASEPETFRSRLESWFPQGTTLTVSTNARLASSCAGTGEPSAITVWLAFPAPALASVTFSYCDRTSGKLRHVQRELPLPGGLDELGQERIAQSIHSSAMALLDGRVDEVGVEVDAPSSSLTPPKALVIEPERKSSSTKKANRLVVRSKAVHFDAPRSSPITGWFAIGYGVALRGVEGMALGPNLRGGFGRAGMQSWAYGLLLEGRLIVPSTFERNGLSVQTSGARTLMAVYAEGRLSHAFSLVAELGTGLDINHYVPSTSANGGYESVGGATDYQFLVSPALRLFTTDVIEFGFGVTLDFLPAKNRYYTLSNEGKTRIVATVWHAQPGIGVSVRWPGHRRVTR